MSTFEVQPMPEDTPASRRLGQAVAAVPHQLTRSTPDTDVLDQLARARDEALKGLPDD